MYGWINELAVQKGIAKGVKIPTPLLNMINGGLHGAGNLDFQEFWMIPGTSKKFSDGLQMGVEIYQTIGDNLTRRGAIHSVGHEGGYAPNFPSNIDAFEVLIETINRKKLEAGVDIFLGVDIAASNFYKDQRYFLKNFQNPLSKEEYIKFLLETDSKYPFLLIEDPIQQGDEKSWMKLNDLISDNVYIVGDDFLVTNKTRLEKAVKDKSCSAIVIKPNQIGTISETISVVQTAKKNKFVSVVSHRSGDTNDTFIADFGVGVQSEFVKFGAPSRGERVVKYNRLWNIERYELNK